MVEFLPHDFTDASEFLDALRLGNRHWRVSLSEAENPDGEWQRDWIFRGQGSVQLPLQPRAWRSIERGNEAALGKLIQDVSQRWEFHQHFDEKFRNRGFFEGIPPKELESHRRKQLVERIRDVVRQAFAELILVNEFVDLADELGFAITALAEWTKRFDFVENYVDLYFPDATRLLAINRVNVFDSVEEQYGFWKQQAISLAQHHGIPTRLLDWTRNPITAAFFAAANASEKADDKIVVYAFHRHMLVRDHLRLIEVPSSSNDFLRAQAGLFTVDLKGEEFYVQTGCYPSLEESVRLFPRVFNGGFYPKRLTLPTLQASNLLRLLWLERVTHAHLMPTLDHVAEAVVTKVRLSGRTSVMRKEDESL